MHFLKREPLDDEIHHTRFVVTIACNALIANTGIYKGAKDIDFPTDASDILGVTFISVMDTTYFDNNCWNSTYAVKQSERLITLTSFSISQNKSIISDGYILYV